MPVAIADFITNLRAQIEADMIDLSGTAPAFVNSLTDDLEEVARGTNGRYALRYLPNGWSFADSNQPRRLLEVEVEIRHRLVLTAGLTTGEDALALDVIAADMVQLVDPRWWETLAEVYLAEPGTAFRERTGDEVRFGVQVAITMPD